MRAIILAGLTAVAAFACSWDYPIWIPRSPSADPLYRFIKHGKAGYIDQRGKVVMPAVLEAGGNYGAEFHDGLLLLSDGKYVDRTGKVVLNPSLFRKSSFSGGLAPAMKKDGGPWGYIGTRGEWAIAPRFASYPNGDVSPFSDGAARIQVKGLYGFIDRTGEFIIPPSFPDASDFSDGMARVVVEGPCVYSRGGPCGFLDPVYVGAREPLRSAVRPPCKFAYIEKSGKVVTKQRFDKALNFSEGLAAVKVGKVWGFIDRSGRMVIPPRFEEAQSFHAGLARISEKGRKGYVDRSGKMLIQVHGIYAGDFQDGLALIDDVTRKWYIDTRGQKIIEGNFEVASDFFKGLAHVKLRRRNAAYAYLDTQGRTVFAYEP